MLDGDAAGIVSNSQRGLEPIDLIDACTRCKGNGRHWKDCRKGRTSPLASMAARQEPVGQAGSWWKPGGG